MMATSNVWLTADLHLGHKNIIEYCKRPFDDANHMDTVIIDNWNSVVAADDIVYVLGDFTMGSAQRALNYIERLTGYITFLPGSHDRWLSDQITRYDNDAFSKHQIAPPIREIKYKEQHITLCHYAMRSWPRSYHGSMQFYGHSHGRLESTRLLRQMDVGVDCHEFYPVRLSRAVADLMVDDGDES